tara:strand:- start:14 stop:340 length:327 start_codon:yes stop_codon:yes gene_type:complete
MSEHPDFNILKNFFNNNIDSLIQITIKERKDKGFGALFMEVNHEKNNVDCRFINRETAYNTPGFKEIYDNLQSNHRPSVAFFVLVVFNKEKDTSEIQILNIDLDKNRS